MRCSHPEGKDKRNDDVEVVDRVPDNELFINTPFFTSLLYSFDYLLLTRIR